jgi:hypothetical protein
LKTELDEKILEKLVEAGRRMSIESAVLMAQAGK